MKNYTDGHEEIFSMCVTKSQTLGGQQTIAICSYVFHMYAMYARL